MSILGKRIKLLREEHGLNQVEFARVLNIGNTTLSQYESGQRVPSDDIKIKIADFFNTSIDYLLGRTDKRDIGESTFKDPNLQEIEGLSEESKKELEQYIRLLKIKDDMDKGKEEQSSTFTKNA